MVKRPRIAIVTLVACALVLVGTPVAVVVMNQRAQDESIVTDVGDLNAALGLPSETASPTPTPEPSASASPTGPSTILSGPGSSSWSPPAAGDYYLGVQEPLPVKVHIPSLDVTAPVINVGLTKDRAMEIPEDIMKVGWYQYSVTPGSHQGSAVIVGHRDGAVQGRGAFYSIGTLDVGDKVVVTNEDGQKLQYKVVARELLDKHKWSKEAPKYFVIDGPARLTLISCGGYYDRAAGGYQSNVIVTAVPTAST